MSINVGRRGSTHDIALARACELQLDVLLIQDPWWSGRTKSHPFFDHHLPYVTSGTRPRAVTYIRKDSSKINAIQQFPISQLTGDYCWVLINGVTFLNVYKAPQNPSAVQPLLDWTPLDKSAAIGDFNSFHWAWQPSASTSYRQGAEIENG